MPKDPRIKKVLVIGSGPIIIGQAAEFDYSGTQACRALKSEGVETVLVNSNPATIMTDPDIADHVYIEPLTAEVVERIIEKEKPDAILPNLGGQMGLNLSMELARSGFLDRSGVRLLACKPDTIDRAEDRQLFKDTMEKLHQPIIPSKVVEDLDDALDFAEVIGYPVIVRPAFTMGGTGGGICEDREKLHEIATNGLRLSPIHQILVEKCISGWKEIEYEVMRDSKGNVITVCNMENLDPVGIHTGDSIVVAPSQTLSDKEYQMLRTAALDIITELGIEGGCNCQFALKPDSFEYAVIEVNPRVSRSSALASKATGYPIAKVATKIALGYTLDEITNDVTGKTCACFEPALDYIVVKYPKWPFDKFVYADKSLGTQMMATGEVMSIGNSFEAAMMKAVSSIELGMDTLTHKPFEELTDDEIVAHLHVQDAERVFCVYEALKRGIDHETIWKITKIDWWFLDKMQHLADLEKGLAKCNGVLSLEQYQTAKKYGFQDKTIKRLAQVDVLPVENYRAGFKMVDTCAAEFSANTPYFYSTYDGDNEAAEFIAAREAEAAANGQPKKKKVLVFGSGPIRIGQGIEFDYCSVHCVWTLKNHGCEAILVNNNPETVSTDFDTGDRLYFDPLNPESVDNIIATEKPDACVVQFGGQTAIKLAKHMDEIGLPILGTPADAIDEAEDRERFAALLDKLGIMYPPAGQATSFEEAEAVAAHIGYPLLVRPSYVLGGRGMMIAYDAEHLRDYMAEAARISPDYPVYLDRFLEGAIESDVDALCDGEEVYIGGILEHIEEAGIHSGDSATCIPPFSFSESLQAKLRETTRRIAMALGVRGLVNVQYAIKGETVYVIEANPRASRTVPFISKATDVPLAKCAARIMAGDSIASLGLPSDERQLDWFCMKEAVMPWGRFPGADVILGPEMKSTGEVMGIAKSYPEAYAKTQLAIDYKLPDPSAGKVFISVCDRDKRHILSVGRILRYLGFDICSTEGTARVLRGGNVTCEVVEKISGPHDGERPNIGDLIADGKIAVIINTPYGPGSRGDGYLLRTEAVRRGVTCVTAMSAANTYVSAIEAVREDEQGHGSANDMGMDVIALQDLPQHTV